MKTKKYILLIIGFAFSLFSCDSNLEVTKDEDKSIDIPIFLKGHLWYDKSENGNFYEIFEIDNLADSGSYFIDVWMLMQKIEGVIPEYKVVINEIWSEFSFKPHLLPENYEAQSCRQRVSLSDSMQTPTTIKLIKGKNNISIVSNNVFPCAELVKFYQNSENGISKEDLISFGFNDYFCLSFTAPIIPEPITFSEAELNQIATLIELLPEHVKNDFEEKYFEWMDDSWYGPITNPNGYPPSHTRYYVQFEEYISLLTFCEQYGKAMWPLVFDKMYQRETFAINLLEDLSFSEYRKIFDDIESAYKKTGSWPALEMMIVYAKILLEIEYDNILKAIQDIPEMENED